MVVHEKETISLSALLRRWTGGRMQDVVELVCFENKLQVFTLCKFLVAKDGLQVCYDLLWATPLWIEKHVTDPKGARGRKDPYGLLQYDYDFAEDFYFLVDEVAVIELERPHLVNAVIAYDADQVREIKANLHNASSDEADPAYAAIEQAKEKIRQAVAGHGVQDKANEPTPGIAGAAKPPAPSLEFAELAYQQLKTTRPKNIVEKMRNQGIADSTICKTLYKHTQELHLYKWQLGELFTLGTATHKTYVNKVNMLLKTLEPQTKTK